MKRRIILASASPRRRELLAQLGLRFEVRVPAVAESRNEDPVTAAEQAALSKASEIAREVKDALVIGADTIVVVGGETLGKPHDVSEAEAMLKKLNGVAHQVVTGIAAVDSSGKKMVGHETTTVVFRSLSREELLAYAHSGEGLDKAGAYGIQGLGALLVSRIEGSYTNVVGLPVAKLDEMLKQFGVKILSER